MKRWEKIIFWVLTTIIVIDNISWQWTVKLTTEPPPLVIGGRLGSMISDIIILGIWLYFLIKIYSKATHKD